MSESPPQGEGQSRLLAEHVPGGQALQALLLPKDAEREVSWDFSTKMLSQSRKISIREDCRLGQSFNSTFFKTNV